MPFMNHSLQKFILFIIAGFLILAGATLLCGSFSEQGQAWWALAGAFCLFTGYWFTLVGRRAGRQPEDEVISPTFSGPAEQKPRKRSFTTRSIVSLSLLIGILACCVLGAVRAILSFMPTTNVGYLPEASIEDMIERCSYGKPYDEPEPWMNPSAGSYGVFEITYKQSFPVIEGYYFYDIYLQVHPDLVEQGPALEIPTQGIQAIVFVSQAPFFYCSSDISGQVQLLEVTPSTTTIRMNLQAQILNAPWSHSGEYRFQTTLPVH